MNLERHLCIVIDRNHPQTTLAEYKVTASDWYFARHQAADKFRKENPHCTTDWCVDSLQLEEPPMIKVKTIGNHFFALYGMVSKGTILEMTPEDAQQAAAAGRVQLL